MESLTQLMSKLNKACTSLDVPASGENNILFSLWEVGDLPFVALIGSQSSGKSSLLESIVGSEFLPRGSSGIVTRRPLILQLHKLEEGKKDYVEFGPSPMDHFDDFDEVRKKIAYETDAQTMDTGAISDRPLYMNFYSPNVVKNLMLIDFPGFEKTVVDDQLINTVEKIVVPYITQPNCIILAIAAANECLLTSEVERVLSKVDPREERTIKVLTKMDLIDEDTRTDIVSMLKLPSHNPWIGVVNDTMRSVHMLDGWEREQMFFAKSEYTDIAHRMGCEFLKFILYQRLENIMSGQTARLTLENSINRIITHLETKLNEKAPKLSKDVASQMSSRLKELRILASPLLKSLQFSHLGKGILTPVVDQMDTAICWIVVAIAATESLIAIKQGMLIPLSIQHIVDCIQHKFEDLAHMELDQFGTFPLVIEGALLFIQKFGVRRESDYPPFVCRKQEECHCKENEWGRIAIKDFHAISFEDIDNAILEQPIGAVMYTFSDTCDIKGDVYCAPEGEFPNEIGHAILIVGYGNEGGIKPYYFVKGSDGETWGIMGYAKIARELVYRFVKPVHPFILS